MFTNNVRQLFHGVLDIKNKVVYGKLTSPDTRY